MRYFWSLILILALGTAGLSAARWSRSGSVGPVAGPSGPAAPITPPITPPMSPRVTPPADARTASSPQTTRAPEPASRPAPEPAAEPEPLIQTPIATESTPAAPGLVAPGLVDRPSEATTPEPGIDPADTPARAPVVAQAAEETPPVNAPPETAPTGSNFSLDELLGVVAEAAERSTPADDPAPEIAQPTPDPMLAAAAQSLESHAAGNDAAETATDAAPASAPAGAPARVGPAFEIRADGSIEIEGVGVIVGAGTPQRPYVLDWDVLRSLSREFNPRQGQSEIPAWTMQLHGKRVRVEGNTLLPVVAQTTNELLVMQNPWDGCCLGVPPTPYDAIEVKLATMQRMGNSPTGYGQVEGVFKVDPYIVSGWLLGLYLIEDAGFESGAGITLPEL